MRARWILLGGASLTLLVLDACVGDDPSLVPAASEDAGVDSSPSDAATGSDSSDAGVDVADSSACNARDNTPCGCGPGNSCCFTGDQTSCHVVGSEDPDACTSTSTIRCIASSCGAGRACCFNGVVTAGSTCEKRATAFDTECFDVVEGERPCVNSTNQVEKVITCLVDEDCSHYDAGHCVSALMDGIARVIGVCATD